MAADWEAVIGLETHVQLGTESKIFTAASTAFGDEPNTHRVQLHDRHAYDQKQGHCEEPIRVPVRIKAIGYISRLEAA